MITQTVTTKHISNTSNLYNGGYLVYWKLYAQFIRMLSNKDEVLNNLRKEFSHLFGKELERKINRRFLFVKLGTYTWIFIWSCIIKPLGQFFSKKVKIEGSYMIPFQNISLEKSTQYKLFGIVFWISKNQKLTEEDIKELSK